MQVWHMSGAGNDFMVLDARGKTLDYPTLAKKLCAMTKADGFMAVDTSDKADFRMHFYNSDGSRGEMCGNGSRCICRFAYENGIAGEQVRVETDAGIVKGERRSKDTYRVWLNVPEVLDLERKPDCAYVELGNPGIPHAVKEVPDLTWDMSEKLRPEAVSLRYDPAFPKGANVNFYRWIGEHTVRVLTYERGVENYTLACGTGCGSVTCVLWALGELPGKHLITEVRGGKLEYHIKGSDHVKELIMDGPTEILKIYEI